MASTTDSCANIQPPLNSGADLQSPHRQYLARFSSQSLPSVEASEHPMQLFECSSVINAVRRCWGEGGIIRVLIHFSFGAWSRCRVQYLCKFVVSVEAMTEVLVNSPQHALATYARFASCNICGNVRYNFEFWDI